MRLVAKAIMLADVEYRVGKQTSACRSLLIGIAQGNLESHPPQILPIC
jgi:hypothetical protein